MSKSTETIQRGVINVGGKSQTIYSFAKAFNKKVKGIKSPKTNKLPLNQTMSLEKLKKILKKK